MTSLAEKPYYEADAPTRREALGILDNYELEELKSLQLRGVEEVELR